MYTVGHVDSRVTPVCVGGDDARYVHSRTNRQPCNTSVWVEMIHAMYTVGHVDSRVASVCVGGDDARYVHSRTCRHPCSTSVCGWR